MWINNDANRLSILLFLMQRLSRSLSRFHDDLLVDSQLNSHPNGGCQEKGPMNNEGLADKGL